VLSLPQVHRLLARLGVQELDQALADKDLYDAPDHLTVISSTCSINCRNWVSKREMSSAVTPRL
jgi:hypothetical protein